VLTDRLRLARNLLVRKVPGFKSAGHAILITAYVAVNLAVTFSEVDFKSMAALGHRFGWYVPKLSIVSPAMCRNVCL
jgi:hypothetical protein